MGSGVDRFTDLRAWQACNVYKKEIYRLCEEPPLAADWKRRGQLEESARGPGAHLADGYGRYLLDLVDRGYISDERRLALNSLAEAALEQVTGLLEYLQSPEALGNARRARERRIASRPERRTSTNFERSTPYPEPERRSQKSEE